MREFDLVFQLQLHYTGNHMHVVAGTTISGRGRRKGERGGRVQLIFLVLRTGAEV